VLRIVKPIDEAALVELANKARLYDVFYSQFGQFGVLQRHQPLCITQPIERRIRFASERQQLILIALLNQRRVAHSEVLHDALQNNGFIRRRDNERETFGQRRYHFFDNRRMLIEIGPCHSQTQPWKRDIFLGEIH